ncbi:hypothetical protein ACFVAE_01580 [Microbacterium sp. NPDC057659]|uniref:hypothetical protein n=1 Tax=Microbacterium sp. NPDC057659 TaxID=3346198 RepID=UPI00366C1E45
MDDVIGWAVIAVWLTMPVVAVALAFRWILSTKPVEDKYENGGGGFAGGLDAVFSPTAYEAGMERDRQTQRTAPAPAPGDPPWTIGDGRIRIDV